MYQNEPSFVHREAIIFAATSLTLIKQTFVANEIDFASNYLSQFF